MNWFGVTRFGEVIAYDGDEEGNPLDLAIDSILTGFAFSDEKSAQKWAYKFFA